MLAPVRTSAPASMPVTLPETKAHLRVDGTDEDGLITALIAAATDHLDGFSGILGRAIITQTWRQDFEGFCDKLRLPVGPLASVSSVTYYDTNNTQQTLSGAIYTALTDERGPFVRLKPLQIWPVSYGRSDAISVTFIAGEAAPPAPIKAAILLMVGDLFAFRETAVTGTIATAIPMSATVDALLSNYRRVGV